jgi:hypothetical protein
LMSLPDVVLHIIGEMVMYPDPNKPKEWYARRYFRRLRRENDFKLYWDIYQDRDTLPYCNEDSYPYVKMTDKHPFTRPTIIREARGDRKRAFYGCGYESQAVCVGERWLDLWATCDALVRNTRSLKYYCNKRLCSLIPDREFYEIHRDDGYDDLNSDYEIRDNVYYIHVEHSGNCRGWRGKPAIYPPTDTSHLSTSSDEESPNDED